METKIENLMSVGEVGELAKISRQRVLQLIESGDLVAVKVGKNYVIRQSDYDLWFDSRREAGRPPNRLKGYVSDYGNSRYKVEFQTGLQQARGFGGSPKEYKPFTVVIDLSGDNPKFDWKVTPENNLEKFEQDGLELAKEYLESKRTGN